MSGSSHVMFLNRFTEGSNLIHSTGESALQNYHDIHKYIIISAKGKFRDKDKIMIYHSFPNKHYIGSSNVHPLSMFKNKKNITIFYLKIIFTTIKKLQYII